MDQTTVMSIGGMEPFFQIPVYAESEDEYHEWVRSKLAGHGDAAVARGGSREQAESFARHFVGIPWTYNRVVGWIELRGAHDVIKGYLTWTTQQRIRLERREPFLMTTDDKMFQTLVHDGMTSAEVFADLCEVLTEECADEPRLKGRWVDRSRFDALGPHIDFRSLLGWADRENLS